MSFPVRTLDELDALSLPWPGVDPTVKRVLRLHIDNDPQPVYDANAPIILDGDNASLAGMAMRGGQLDGATRSSDDPGPLQTPVCEAAAAATIQVLVRALTVANHEPLTRSGGPLEQVWLHLCDLDWASAVLVAKITVNGFWSRVEDAAAKAAEHTVANWTSFLMELVTMNPSTTLASSALSLIEALRASAKAEVPSQRALQPLPVATRSASLVKATVLNAAKSRLERSNIRQQMQTVLSRFGITGANRTSLRNIVDIAKDPVDASRLLFDIDAAMAGHGASDTDK